MAFRRNHLRRTTSHRRQTTTLRQPCQPSGVFYKLQGGGEQSSKLNLQDQTVLANMMMMNKHDQQTSNTVPTIISEEKKTPATTVVEHTQEEEKQHVDLRQSCKSRNQQMSHMMESFTPETADPFHPNFDPAVYAERYSEKVSEGTVLDFQHFESIGKQKGWVCIAGQKLRTLMNALVDQLSHPSLELGPFCNPMLYGNTDKIRYFDVLNYHGLKERAKIPSKRMT